MLIPFAVELVDVGRAEGSPEVRRHVPQGREVVVPADAVGEVREALRVLEELLIDIVASYLERHLVETQTDLSTPALGLVLLQEVCCTRDLGVVRDDGYDTRARAVVVLRADEVQTYLRIPAVVVLAPSSICLEALQVERQRGEGGAVIAADVVLISAVGLQRGLQGEGAEMLIIIAPLDAPQAVQDVVVRVVNMAGEGAEGQRTTTLDERLDLVGILEVPRGKKPRLILILAEVALEREVLATPAEGE